MKLFFALIFSALVIAGCGEDKKEPETVLDEKNKYSFDTSDVKTETVDNPNEPFLMRYRFEKGKTYKYRLTTLSTVKQEMKADTTLTQDLFQSIIYLVDLNVNEIDADSVLDLNANVSSIKVNMDGGTQSVSYEYGTLKDSSEIKKYAEYEALANNPFGFRISKTGELLEVYKADKILNRLLDIKGLTDSVKTTQEKTLLRNDIIEGMLKPILNQIVRKLPDNSVAKDSVWKLDQVANRIMVFEMKNQSSYKINNLEKLDDDKIAVVNAGLITSITGNNRVTDRGVTYNFNKPVTSGTGKIYFNVTDGLISKSKVRTTVDMFYTMEIPTPQGTQKRSMKEAIENNNILELL